MRSDESSSEGFGGMVPVQIIQSGSSSTLLISSFQIFARKSHRPVDFSTRHRRRCVGLRISASTKSTRLPSMA